MPKTFVSKTSLRRLVRGRRRRAGVRAPLMPALLIRTSSPPSASICAARGRDGGVVGDVELDEARTQLLGGRAAAPRVACADVDGVTGGDEPAGGLVAEALVRSGDQCRCHAPRLRRAPPVSKRSALP